MIQIITAEDVKDIYSILQKIDERTKIHTKQIHELQKRIKEMGGENESTN